LLRNEKAAIIGWVLLASSITGTMGNPWIFLMSIVSNALILWILMRFGLVSLVFLNFVGSFALVPATLDSSAWYFGKGLTAVALFMIVILYAFRHSLGGRTLLGASHLDD
jgi:hypothetical protein